MNPTKEQLADPKWWSQNAPADATHYACAEPNCRPLWVKNGYYSCADEAFVRWREDHAPFIHGELISRPTTWNGEGLPPAGTVCEVMHDGRWYETVIIGVDPDDGSVVFRAHDDFECPYDGYTSPRNFRPLRTPELIAAEEREKAVDEMVAISPMLDKYWARKVCTALYDHGYRKQEQTK